MVSYRKSFDTNSFHSRFKHISNQCNAGPGPQIQARFQLCAEWQMAVARMLAIRVLQQCTFKEEKINFKIRYSICVRCYCLLLRILYTIILRSVVAFLKLRSVVACVQLSPAFSCRLFTTAFSCRLCSVVAPRKETTG